MIEQSSASKALQRFDFPLDIEDVQEFHITRILLLMRICGQGKNGTVRGRTKLAKLDFFVRYPRFLEVGLGRLRKGGSEVPDYYAGTEGVEASMVRYRFGPWDHRYYNLLASMVARGLIRIGCGAGNTESFSLTPAGVEVADKLIAEPVFAPVTYRCQVIASSLANFKGTELKNFIYETFENEVSALPQGTIIPHSTDR